MYALDSSTLGRVKPFPHQLRRLGWLSNTVRLVVTSRAAVPFSFARLIQPSSRVKGAE